MPTLYVRDCPQELHEKLCERARIARRSVNAEVIAMLEEGVQKNEARQRASALLVRAARRRRALPPSATDSAELIREDRGR